MTVIPSPPVSPERPSPTTDPTTAEGHLLANVDSSRDVVIYDGHCNFCQAQTDRLKRWDTKGRLAFLSLHDPIVQQRYPDLTYDYLMTNMVVVDTRGRRHPGAEAFRYLSRRLPRLYWLAPLMYIPGMMPVWRWCYKQFARQRYRVSGRKCDGDICEVHFR